MALSKLDRITPKCCKKVKENQTVFLHFGRESIYSVNEEVKKHGQDNQKPEWVSSAYKKGALYPSAIKVKFCPHCSRPLPKIKRRKTKRKICSVKDGGYYCDTCKERLNQCECYRPEYAWEAEDSYENI